MGSSRDPVRRHAQVGGGPLRTGGVPESREVRRVVMGLDRRPLATRMAVREVRRQARAWVLLVSQGSSGHVRCLHRVPLRTGSPGSSELRGASSPGHVRCSHGVGLWSLGQPSVSVWTALHCRFRDDASRRGVASGSVGHASFNASKF